MNRTLKRYPMIGGGVRNETTIEGPTCEVFTPEYDHYRVAFLQQLATTPGLTDCGYHRFQTLTIWHDGNKWMAKATASGD